MPTSDFLGEVIPGPGTGWYLAVGAAGTLLVAKLARWHALWLIPVATAAFAVVYRWWLWDEPAGIPDSGMDAIGYYPTDVVYVVWAMLTVLLAIALLLGAYSLYTPWWRDRR